MKFISLFSLCSITSLFSNTVASPNQIISLINKERHKYSLDSIVYNETVNEALVKFNETIDWYYTPSQNFSYKYHFANFSRRWNGDFVMELKQFSEFKKDGWSWLFRDRTFRTIPFIIKERINQRPCFKWSRCNQTYFDDYVTCLKSYPRIPNIPSKQCSWSYQYYPKMVQWNLKQISCIKLYNKGLNPQYLATGFHKPMAFFCYGQVGPVLHDYPFD